MTADHPGFHQLIGVDRRLQTVLVHPRLEELVMNVAFLKITPQGPP